MNLRKASMGDAQILFDWRNDPVTRAASHQGAPLVYEEHVEWLNRTLANNRRRLYVVELDGAAVGTLRADLGDVTELSWTVAPQHRGRGLGTRIVQAALAMHSPARAEIKAGNVASIRIAERAGMRLEKVEGGVLHYRAP